MGALSGDHVGLQEGSDGAQAATRGPPHGRVTYGSSLAKRGLLPELSNLDRSLDLLVGHAVHSLN